MEDRAGRQAEVIHSIAGRWHLLGSDADETNIPRHRVDLVFSIKDEGVQGAIISHASGEEIPLANVQFDGKVLAIRMRPSTEDDGSRAPLLVLQATHDRFEGEWSEATNAGRLKLIRARETR